jgi:hypothetical protein
MRHIISTLSADTRYTNWRNDAGLNTPDHSVLVRGGAGVALIGGGQIVETPQGVRTEVSDSDAVFLSEHPQFKEHVARGFVRILNTAQDPDKVAESMASDVGSLPKTPEDVKKAADEAAKKQEAGTPPLQAVTNKAK